MSVRRVKLKHHCSKSVALNFLQEKSRAANNRSEKKYTQETENTGEGQRNTITKTTQDRHYTTLVGNFRKLEEGRM